MAEQEVVFSDFIAEKIEGEVGALKPRKVPARQAIRNLHGSLKRALDRGVPESELLDVLKKNGIRLSPKVFREYMETGRPGRRMNAGGAERAGEKLNGGEGGETPPGDAGGGQGAGAKAGPTAPGQ